MINLVSWNIQNGLGCDNEISLARIAKTINSLCDPDIICLQEVSVNLTLSDQSRPNQVEQLAELFPDYQYVFDAAIDAVSAEDSDENSRWQYGNIILSRLPIVSTFKHALPHPPDNNIKYMPRSALEVTVRLDDNTTAEQSHPCTPNDCNTLRIMTTHLEYHSYIQRMAQSRRIAEIQNDVNNFVAYPPDWKPNSPYQQYQRSKNTVICGDFNFSPDSDEYNVLIKDNFDAVRLLDGWRVLHADAPHPPTCGIFDRVQWQQGPHCRDYMFISDNLKKHLHNMTVDTETNASDHQPVLLTLNI